MRYGVDLASVGEFSNAGLLASLAHEAEDSGWDGVFIWDHIGQPNAAADAWVSLAAMAVNTKHVTLGTIITPVPRRRPWKLARETVTLDHLSNGRLVLGVGLGWINAEFETFGEEGDPKIRAEKLDEGLEVLTGLWTGKNFNYSGKHYQIKDACFLPPPLQSPRIPIWVCGAWSDKKAPFRRAARWDGVVAVAAADRAIFPEEISEIKAYLTKYRANDDPFDIVIILRSEGGRNAQELEQIARYEEAGVTWWLDDLSHMRFGSVEEARKRLHKGPPG